MISKEMIWRKHSSFVLQILACPLGPGIVFIIFFALTFDVFESDLLAQIVSLFFPIKNVKPCIS